MDFKRIMIKIVSFQIALITYDRSVHFYSMPEGSSQPTQLTVSDIDGKATTKMISFPICTKLNKTMTLCNSRFTDSNLNKNSLLPDIFLPSPSDLLVNLQENRSLIMQLLEGLPNLFADSHATESALGAALQAAFKIASPTGTVPK